jgi:DNA primase
VLINANCYSIWLQNEVTLPERELLLFYISRFSDIVILFDNDDTGILNANKFSNYLSLPNVRTLFIPYKNIKDSADLFFNKGKDKLVEFLQINNIKFKEE